MATRSASAEWKAYWPLVLASTIGFSLYPVATHVMGLFLEPLEQEFGWSRAQIFFGLTIAHLTMVPLSPVVGEMIDRWGSRPLAIAGCILTALSFASFGLANGSIMQWIALWGIYSIVTLGVKATVWTAAVTGVFTAARGVALAITLTGAALAQIVGPPLTYSLIESFGWRQAFIILGLGWGGVVLIPILWFMFDAHDHERRRATAFPESPQARSLLTGISVPAAIRSVVLWRIAGASLLTMLLGIGVITHQVPILTEAGVSRANAAFLASLAGIAGVGGKLVTGWLMDRRDASMIGGVTLASAAIGFLLLLESFGSPTLIVIAMLIIGYTTGAKLQISAYLTSRYGGTRNFGKIFGVMTSLIAVGTGVGPVLAGAIHDACGSYSPFLIAAIPGSIVSGLLIIGLGPYPDWAANKQLELLER